ncbi:putative F-box/FBD/LRR-repeat protein At1g78760 [Amaranthus tricolor]|uniref:putative F-box/FBD/LRR-repeat protein At1g78760 n=1 Tax=Amaranthus tricolor TaxID=29722 RepID=UPI00258FE8CD|nr:putative F-box/FBD/LRR-repeat protein At1g78760 [Amaranthus tricolor]XP_057522234.1 putative F-box/FBD/LRR-repeat protein At1g78760 [Amaranthus tricolor]
MDEGTSSVDRISELPVFILHQILSSLSTKEAAQTVLLSKRWQYVWETFPILDCNEWFFGKELYMLNPKELGLPKDERRKIFNQRVKFMSYVDEKLHRFVVENLCVQKFILHITLVSNNLASHVDDWIEMITNLFVRELDLYLTVSRERFYVLPMKVFAMESLTVLNLRGCLISTRFDWNTVKLCSLIELHLRDVFIDKNTIQDIISSIPSLEVFSLKNCLGFENVEICGHDKLKKMVYYPRRDLETKKFSIKVSTLEELNFVNLDKDKTECEIAVSPACRNLKRLSVYGMSIDAHWLPDMIASFPLLELLSIGGCVLRRVIKLSSPVLKEIHINNCRKLRDATFDTPNVHSFVYVGRSMPRLYLNSHAGNRVAELSVDLKNMDCSWFMKMNNFIIENKFKDLTLCMTSKTGKEIPFNAEDLIGMLRSPAELNNLKLGTFAVTLDNYGTFLDGLLWSTRPAILSLELNYYSPEFLKGLFKSLVIREPKCCCSHTNSKCWRCLLKDIKLIDVKGFESNTRLDQITLNKLISFLDDWVIAAQQTVKSYKILTGETLSFHFSWS